MTLSKRTTILSGISILTFLSSFGIIMLFGLPLDPGLAPQLHVSPTQVWGALALAILSTVIYVSLRFRSLGFGIGALLALIHDLVLSLAVVALSGVWFGTIVDITVVMSLIAVVAFSLHDTLIVYDHVREYKRKTPNEGFSQIVKHAVESTFLRSLRSSLVLLLILISLVFFGPESLHLFSAVLIVGVMSGAYSSLGVAVPVILASNKIEEKLQ